MSWCNDIVVPISAAQGTPNHILSQGYRRLKDGSKLLGIDAAAPLAVF